MGGGHRPYCPISYHEVPLSPLSVTEIRGTHSSKKPIWKTVRGDTIRTAYLHPILWILDDEQNTTLKSDLRIHILIVSQHFYPEAYDCLEGRNNQVPTSNCVSATTMNHGERVEDPYIIVRVATQFEKGIRNKAKGALYKVFS